MSRKLLLYFVFFVLTVSLVIAITSSSSSSGGGGGPSSGSSPSGGGDGPYFYGLKCFDTGQLMFKQKPSIKPVVVEKEDGTNFTILGEWEGTTFASEEAELINIGNYTLSDSTNGNKTVECPGLKFSCKLVKLNIQNCFYEENKVTTEFTLTGEGTFADDLRFKFKNWNSSHVLEYQKNTVISSELKNVQLQDKGNNTYTLEVTSANPISSLEVTYSACIGKYYIYSKIDCTEKEEIPLSVNAIKPTNDETTLKEVIKEKQKEQSIFSKIIILFKRLIASGLCPPFADSSSSSALHSKNV
ncbi:MAG: hypothetical protein AABX04_08380 [Nanoarchaeota archaeon]